MVSFGRVCDLPDETARVLLGRTAELSEDFRIARIISFDARFRR
jgi:hypothetical protein